MTSRTPIRLTPHRGPLATPSTSPESSPTSSTPPSDISDCFTADRPTLDVAALQRRISTLSPLTRHQSRSHPDRRRRKVTKQGLFGRSTHLTRLGLIFERLMYSTIELAKALAGIITFCLFIWGLLEWSSHTSELPRQPSLSISMPRLPLPSPRRAMRCHANPSLCEPNDQHAAVLLFLSEQIHHAKALSSLSGSLGLPLREFLEAHRAAIPSVIVRHHLPELPHHVQEVDSLANLTESLDPPILELTPDSFIGRSFTLALEELGDLISEPTVSDGSSAHEERHLFAIYWRTTSNLLLEYTAARPRAQRVLQRLHAFHQQLSPLASHHHIAESIENTSNTRWWNGIIHASTSTADRMQAFVTGLEVSLDNLHRLIAYLDWITEKLAQTTLKDVLKTRHRTDFSSCMTSLQETFARSKPSAPKKICFCLNDYRALPPSRPERVEIMIPGSPTVHAER